MHYIGVDIVEIARIEKAIARRGEGFLRRIFTKPELKLCYKKPASLAARFAGKEAVIKALGRSIKWREIEILADRNGKPLVHLHGKAQSQADSLGLDRLTISLSHPKEYAIAFVVGETKGENPDLNC
ncbi:MAG: holo-ACP synthase [Dehalococcoidales bacterium]